MKSGFVSIIGRPSSGKSTLLNALCGYKVSIVSPTPQTTMNRIRGIVNGDAGQLVFIDTPGFHTSERRLNLHLKELVVTGLDEVDLLLYVVDVTRPPGEEEQALLEIVSRHRKRTVAALNKIDIGSGQVESGIRFLESTLSSERIYQVSAATGEGLEELADALFGFAPEGEIMYPEDMYTDQTPEFRATEIIREKAINKVRQELPHAIYVSIADMETSTDGQSLWIRAFLNVERESQKGIVVGKGGAVIKAIRTEAQRELSSIFPYRVKLDLRVKVLSDWRKRENLLRKIIF